MKKITSILISFAILSACATVAPLPIISNYDKSEVEWSFSDGTGRVEGNAFLSRRDGMLVKCSGQQASLIPVGTYSTERFTKLYGNVNGGYNTFGLGRVSIESESPDYLEYSEDYRGTICDVDGKFVFENLPSGEYYVVTSVIWQINNYTYEGGNIARKIEVTADKTTKVTLSY